MTQERISELESQIAVLNDDAIADAKSICRIEDQLEALEKQHDAMQLAVLYFLQQDSESKDRLKKSCGIPLLHHPLL